MKTYEITLQSGKIIEVDAPDAQTAAKVAARYEAQQTRAPAAKPQRRRTEGVFGEVAGLMANVNRGFGIGDEIVAGLRTAGDVVTGKLRPTRNPDGTITPGDIAGAFRRNMGDQRAVEDDFAQRRPKVAAVGRGVGMLPLAAVPIGAGASTTLAAAAAKGATTAATEAAVYSLADRGTGQERVQNANRSILPAAMAGGALGAAGYAMTRPRMVRTDEDLAAQVLVGRAGADPAQMRAAAQAMRDVGVAPTGLDVIGERGRRVSRAVGVRTDTAGEILTDNAMKRSAATKPAVMSNTRRLVDDPRTVTAYVDDLTTARGDAATTQYREPYQAMVQIDADAASALRGDPGRAAIQRARQAAVARQDYNQVQELDSLLAPNMNEFPEVSAGTLDRIRIAMGERAETAGRRGARDIASGLRSRQSAITRALDNVEGLGEARTNFRQTTQAINVADGTDRLDIFSTDPADYGQWVQSLGPEARRANAMAIRQEILDTLGGQRSSTLGSLDDLATSPYVRQNLAAAVGNEAADGYLRNIAARLRQTRNASMVTPGGGARTAVLENDLGEAGRNVAAGANAVQQGLRVDVIGLAQTAADWWRRRGVSPAQAEALARVTTDEGMLDRLIAAAEARGGQGAGRDFLQTLATALNDAGPQDPALAALRREVSARLSRPAGLAVAAPEPAVEVSIPARPELGVGVAY